MFTGRQSKFNPKTQDHTMVINIDKTAGSFTALVWDGFQSHYAKGNNKAYVGRYVKGDKRIEVLVYGGKMPQQTIVNLLTAFVGGKWVKMTLEQVTGGATIPKHTL
jgi:hypothetical protein